MLLAVTSGEIKKNSLFIAVLQNISHLIVSVIHVNCVHISAAGVIYFQHFVLHYLITARRYASRIYIMPVSYTHLTLPTIYSV